MKDFAQTLVGPAMPILEAIKAIEAGSRQIALVVDDAKHLLGTVTDGDVRRGILRGIGLDQPVSAVMNSRPLTANLDQGREAVLRMMRDREIHQIPLLDSDGRLVGLETLDELIHSDQVDVWVVLMAGGWGTRLRPLTDHTPKPLLPVGGRPLLETIIENFANQGFQKIFLSVNYKAEMFERHFGDGSRFGVRIEYIHETDRRGTAGALTLLPSRPESPLIVMNADLLTTLDFRQFLEFHRAHCAKATMGVREYSFQVPYGVVKADQARLLSITEKPVQHFFVSAGMYVLEPEAVNVIPRDTFYDMPMLFEALLAEGAEASVFPVREYWLDIGRLDDLERAQSEFGKVFG
jgi:dTDP-glucose pyrophosphorylase